MLVVLLQIFSTHVCTSRTVRMSSYT